MSNKIPHKLMQFFSYKHLPDHLKQVSANFCHLAEIMDEMLPVNSEKETAMRKLLEAKDCAVRAVLFKDDGMVQPNGRPQPLPVSSNGDGA